MRAQKVFCEGNGLKLVFTRVPLKPHSVVCRLSNVVSPNGGVAWQLPNCRCPRHNLIIRGERLGKWRLAAVITASSEQSWVKGEPFRLTEGDSLEGGMGWIEQVVEFSWDDDAGQREHR